jgi:hypothetical protein
VIFQTVPHWEGCVTVCVRVNTPPPPCDYIPPPAPYKKPGVRGGDQMVTCADTCS